jgi:putative transposase
MRVPALVSRCARAKRRTQPCAAASRTDGLNPSAARSLDEGIEETPTVHRLRVPSQLRQTLAGTNVIESAFSIVETVCRSVKRWRAGDHIERWVGSGITVAECQLRKVQGYPEIPAPLSSRANAISK